MTQNICGKNKSADILYCILHVSTNNSFLNVSLLDMRIASPGQFDCLLGGLSYYQSEKQEMSLCDNFAKSPNYRILLTKVPIDFVSNKSSIRIVLYSYQPNPPDLNFTVSLSKTPCIGIFPCRYGKYTILLQFMFNCCIWYKKTLVLFSNA